MKKKFIIILLIIALCICFILTFGACSNNDLGEKVGEVSITIECKTILNNMHKVEQGLLDSGLIPKDGIILPESQVDIYEKDNVGTLLKRVCEQNKIHLDYTYEQVFRTYYIKGINHIYEMSVGESSGWMYFVDGIEANKGVSQTKLVGGEKIKIAYTCEPGDLQ